MQHHQPGAGDDVVVVLSVLSLFFQAVAENLPASQSSQAPAPAAAENLPATQLRQDVSKHNS